APCGRFRWWCPAPSSSPVSDREYARGAFWFTDPRQKVAIHRRGSSFGAQLLICKEMGRRAGCREREGARPMTEAAYDLCLADRAYSSWSLRGWLLFRAFGIEA